MSRKSKALLTKTALIIVSTLVTFFVFDRVLGLIGFPDDVPIRVAHPPNFTEVRHNIEFRYEFRTNSQGLRDREVPLDKPAGSSRVFVVGDSFTEGFGVEAEQRFTTFLEQHFSTETRTVLLLNGGLTGTGPKRYGRMFLHVGLKYNPDALLICIFANDVTNTSASGKPQDIVDIWPQRQGMQRIIHDLWPRTDALLHAFLEHKELQNETKVSDVVAVAARRALRNGIPQERVDAWAAALPTHLVDAVNRGEFNGAGLTGGLLRPDYWTDALDISNEKAEARWQVMVALLTEIIHQSHQRSVEVGVVFIPTVYQYDPRSHDKNKPPIAAGIHVKNDWLHAKTEIQKRLETWAAEKDVPFLDLTPIFRDAVKVHTRLTYELDGHWTPTGHMVAGKAIAEWLTDQSVFSFLNSSP